MSDTLQVASFTVAMAILATLVALPPGLAVAWVLARRRFAGRVVLETLVSLPLVLPPVATGLILIAILGRRGPLGRLFAQLGIEGVQVKVGDGYLGWPEQAPFDGIIVTAAPDHVPQPLIEQLAVGGKLVLPVGRGFQIMTVLTKTEGGITTSETIPVRFVPMTGRARAR